MRGFVDRAVFLAQLAPRRADGEFDWRRHGEFDRVLHDVLHRSRALWDVVFVDFEQKFVVDLCDESDALFIH